MSSPKLMALTCFRGVVDRYTVQTHQQTHPCEYYRRTITIPLLDHMLTELNNRFRQHQQLLYLVCQFFSSWFGM